MYNVSTYRLSNAQKDKGMVRQKKQTFSLFLSAFPPSVFCLWFFEDSEGRINSVNKKVDGYCVACVPLEENEI